MASKWRRKRAGCCQQLFIFCLLLRCSAENQVPVLKSDAASSDVTIVLELAAILRNSMIHALGTILQHHESERQLTWEDAVIVRRLHDGLASRLISTVNKIPEAQQKITNKRFSSTEQQIVQLLRLLAENCFHTMQWDKYISLLEVYSVGTELKEFPKLLREVNISKLSNFFEHNNFIDRVFKSIKFGYISLTPSLLAALLDNFPFPCIIPETNEALRDVVKILAKEKHALKEHLPKITIESEDNFNIFLINVLKFLGSNDSPLESTKKLKIWMIMPFLQADTCKNIAPQIQSFRNRHHELFLALKDDDCPRDVIGARNDFMSAIESGKLDFSKYVTHFIPEDYGSNRLAILYGYLSRLSFSVPYAHPASAYIHTLLSYVKFKYISSKGGTFVPTTPLDIALLLDSFNTLGIELSEINTEIYKAFLNDIHWRVILKNFPYKHYSQPRTLFIGMLNRILLSDEKIKLCHKIVLKYFLEKVQNSVTTYQNIPISVSYNIQNPFQNCTAQCGKTMGTVSLPVNVLKETIPLKHTQPEQERGRTLIPQNKRYSTVTSSYEIFTSDIKNNKAITEIDLLSRQTTNKSDGASATGMFKLFQEKCTSNSHLDREIKSAVGNIVHHMKYISKNTTVTCIDENDKLYLAINNQIQIIPRITSCQDSSDAYWIDVPSLLTAVNDKVSEEDLRLVKDILTYGVIQGFDVRKYQSKGKLIYELLKYATMNLILHPNTKNVIKTVMNNIHMVGAGSAIPVLICFKTSKDEVPVTGISKKGPDKNDTKTCIDFTTKEKGIKAVSVNISSLFYAFHPSTPQELKGIVTAYLNIPSVIREIHNLNLDIYATRGEILVNILTYWKNQGNKTVPAVSDAIAKIIPFIQKDGPGSLNPEIHVICRIKSKHSASLSVPFQNENVKSTLERETVHPLSKITVKYPSSSEHVTEMIYSTKYETIISGEKRKEKIPTETPSVYFTTYTTEDVTYAKVQTPKTEAYPTEVIGTGEQYLTITTETAVPETIRTKIKYTPPIITPATEGEEIYTIIMNSTDISTTTEKLDVSTHRHTATKPNEAEITQTKQTSRDSTTTEIEKSTHAEFSTQTTDRTGKITTVTQEYFTGTAQNTEETDTQEWSIQTLQKTAITEETESTKETTEMANFSTNITEEITETYESSTNVADDTKKTGRDKFLTYGTEQTSKITETDLTEEFLTVSTEEMDKTIEVIDKTEKVREITEDTEETEETTEETKETTEETRKTTKETEGTTKETEETTKDTKETTKETEETTKETEETTKGTEETAKGTEETTKETEETTKGTEETTKGTEETTKGTEETTKGTEETIKETEVTDKEIEETTKETGETTKETEETIKETEETIKGTEETTKEFEETIKDIEETTEETGKATEDKGETTEGTEETTEETEETTEETEETTEETEETEETTEETEETTEETEETEEITEETDEATEETIETQKETEEETEEPGEATDEAEETSEDTEETTEVRKETTKETEETIDKREKIILETEEITEDTEEITVATEERTEEIEETKDFLTKDTYGRTKTSEMSLKPTFTVTEKLSTEITKVIEETTPVTIIINSTEKEFSTDITETKATKQISADIKGNAEELAEEEEFSTDITKGSTTYGKETTDLYKFSTMHTYTTEEAIEKETFLTERTENIENKLTSNTTVLGLSTDIMNKITKMLITIEMPEFTTDLQEASEISIMPEIITTITEITTENPIITEKERDRERTENTTKLTHSTPEIEETATKITDLLESGMTEQTLAATAIISSDMTEGSNKTEQFQSIGTEKSVIETTQLMRETFPTQSSTMIISETIFPQDKITKTIEYSSEATEASYGSTLEIIAHLETISDTTVKAERITMPVTETTLPTTYLSQTTNETKITEIYTSETEFPVETISYTYTSEKASGTSTSTNNISEAVYDIGETTQPTSQIENLFDTTYVSETLNEQAKTITSETTKLPDIKRVILTEEDRITTSVYTIEKSSTLTSSETTESFTTAEIILSPEATTFETTHLTQETTESITRPDKTLLPKAVLFKTTYLTEVPTPESVFSSKPTMAKTTYLPEDTTKINSVTPKTKFLQVTTHLPEKTTESIISPEKSILSETTYLTEGTTESTIAPGTTFFPGVKMSEITFLPEATMSEITYLTEETTEAITTSETILLSEAKYETKYLIEATTESTTTPVTTHLTEENIEKETTILTPPTTLSLAVTNSEKTTESITTTETILLPKATISETTYLFEGTPESITITPEITLSETTYLTEGLTELVATGKTLSSQGVISETTYLSGETVKSIKTSETTMSETKYLTEKTTESITSQETIFSSEEISDTTYLFEETPEWITSAKITLSPQTIMTETTHLTEEMIESITTPETTLSSEGITSETRYLMEETTELITSEKVVSPEATVPKITHFTEGMTNEATKIPETTSSSDTAMSEITYLYVGTNESTIKPETTLTRETTISETAYLTKEANKLITTLETILPPEVTISDTIHITEETTEIITSDKIDSPGATMSETIYFTEGMTNESITITETSSSDTTISEIIYLSEGTSESIIIPPETTISDATHLTEGTTGWITPLETTLSSEAKISETTEKINELITSGTTVSPKPTMSKAVNLSEETTQSITSQTMLLQKIITYLPEGTNESVKGKQETTISTAVTNSETTHLPEATMSESTYLNEEIPGPFTMTETKFSSEETSSETIYFSEGTTQTSTVTTEATTPETFLPETMYVSEGIIAPESTFSPEVTVSETMYSSEGTSEQIPALPTKTLYISDLFSITQLNITESHFLPPHNSKSPVSSIETTPSPLKTTFDFSNLETETILPGAEISTMTEQHTEEISISETLPTLVISSETSEITTLEILNTSTRKSTTGTTSFSEKSETEMVVSSLQKEIFEEEKSSNYEVTSSTTREQPEEKDTTLSVLRSRVTQTTPIITPSPQTIVTTIKETVIPKTSQVTLSPILEPTSTRTSLEKYNISKEWTPISTDYDEMFTLPTIFQILTDENKTDISSLCPYPQIPIGIPDIKSLLEAVDTGVSRKSLDTVIEFFGTDPLNKLSSFYTEEILTKSELLSKILIFIKSTYSDLKPDEQEALTDVLLHIEFTGKGADKTDFKIICMNKSDVIQKAKVQRASQLPIKTIGASNVDSALKHPSEKNITNKCDGLEIPIVIPNIKSLITVVDDTVPKSTLKRVINLFKAKDIGNIIKDFSTNHTTKAKLLADLLKYIINSHKNLEPYLLEAFRQVLLNIKSHEQEILKSDLTTMYVCQEAEIKSAHTSYTPSTGYMETTELEITELPPLPEIENIIIQSNETTIQCTENQNAVIILNLKTLLKAVNRLDSQKSMEILLHFFKENNSDKILDGFKINETLTTAKLLKEILTFIKFKHRNLEPSLLQAIDDILTNIELDGEGDYKPDFVVSCQDNEYNAIPQATGSRQTAAKSTDLKLITETAEIPTQPIGEDFHFENIEDYQCPENQIAVIFPNVKSLLKAVKPSTPKNSLEIVFDFFKKSNLAKLVEDARIQQFETRAALLSEILSFTLLRYDDILEPYILDAIGDVFHNIESEGEGALQPEFTVLCQDVKKITTPLHMTEINISTLPPHFITIPAYKIQKQHRITPEFAPAVATLAHSVTLPSKHYNVTTEDRTSEFMVNIVTSTIPSYPTMTRCPQDKVMITVPNIKLILQLAEKNFQKQTKEILNNLFERRDLLEILHNFNISKHDKKSELFSSVLTFIKNDYASLDNSQINAIDEVIKLMPHIQFENYTNPQLEYLEICLDFQNQKSTAVTPNHTVSIHATPKKCNDNQTAVNIPDINSLLKAVNPSISVKSLTILKIFFEINNISQELSFFHFEPFITRAELLKKILNDIKSRHTDLKSSLLNTFKDILDNILYDGEGALQPDFIVICKNVSKEAIKPNFMSIQETHTTAISGSLAITDIPKTSTPKTNLDLFLTFKDKVKTQNTSNITGNCTKVNLPNIYPLLQSVDDKVSKEQKTLIYNLFNTNTLYKLYNFDVTKYETNAKLFKDILLFIESVSELNSSQIAAVKEISKHIQHSSKGALRPEFTQLCLNTTYYGGDTVIPQRCSDPNTIQILGIDFLSLFEATDSSVSKMTKENIIKEINTAEIQNELKILNWDHYNSKGLFLKDILTYLISNKPEKFKDRLSNLLPHITINSSGDDRLIFKFICLPIAESFNLKKTPVMKIKSQEECPQNPLYKTIYLVNTSSLLESIKPTAPKLEKTGITILLYRDNISSLLNGFDVKKYERKGLLLKGLLNHLSFETALKPNELDNINTMLCFISLDGPSALPPDIEVMCDMESDTATIIIPRECAKNNSIPHLVVDVPTLLNVVDKNAVTEEIFNAVQSILQDSKVQQHFSDSHAETNENRGKILWKLLNYAKLQVSKNESTVNAINKVLEYVSLSSSEHLQPIVKFICNNEILNDCGTNSDGDVVTPLYVLRPTEIFQSLARNTSQRHRNTVWKYLTKLNFYKNIAELNIIQFKTQGELLKGILEYLIKKPLERNLTLAINHLIKSVRLDGPGKEKLNLSVQCNFTIPSNSNDMPGKPMIIPPPIIPMTKPSKGSYQKFDSTGLPNKCPDENSFYMYAIDIAPLFQAVNSKVSKILLKNIIDIIDTPSMLIKLNDLSWDKYDTKAELLIDVLSYVMLNTTQPPEVIKTLKKISSQVNLHGTGAEYPVYKYICVPTASSYLNEPVIIKSIPGTCKNLSTDQGSPALIVNIKSLLKAVKPNTPLIYKAIAMSFFQTPEFGNFIHDFKINNFKTQGELLQGLISSVLAKGGLEPNVLNGLKKLLSNVQLKGSGALSPDVKITCQSLVESATKIPKQLFPCEELYSDVMVIPSQYPGDQTMNGMFMVDLPTLYTAIDPNAPFEIIPVIKKAIQDSDVYLTLMDFEWNNYKTRGELLKDILLFIIEKMPRDSKVHQAVDTLLPYILTSGPGAKPPIIKYEYEIGDQTHNTHVLNNCDDGIKPLYVINIPSLLKIIKPGTPKVHKNLVASFLGRFDLYKKIRSIKIEKYNTTGEFLQELLAHLLMENSLHSDLVKAISSLILNIKSDACANNPINFTTVCNVTVPKSTSRGPECQLQTKPKNQSYKFQEISTGSTHLISKCFDNGTTEMLAVDISPLLDDLQLSNNLKLQLIELLKESKVQNTLAVFDWEIPYINNNDLLVNILQFLLSTLSPDYKHYTVIEETLSSLTPEVHTDVPNFTFTCLFEEKETITGNKVNPLKGEDLDNVSLLQEITRGPAIIKPSKGKCDNGAIPILSVNIPVLFEALASNTNPLAKSIVSTYLSRPNFYKSLNNFSLASFRTRGEQLQELLIHLVTHTSRDSTLMKAIDKLLPNVQLDGHGKLPPSIKIVCNNTLHRIMQLPFTKYKAKAPKIISVKKSVLTPCIMSSSGVTYQIDISSTFYALKPNAPQMSLSKIIEYFNKPDFHTILKGFDIESQKTKGDLLISLFKFLVMKLEHEPSIISAIQDILPFVYFDGPGADSTNVIPNCTFHDTTQKLDIEHKPPIQGLKLIDENENECMSNSLNISRRKGITIFKIHTQVLSEILNNTETKVNALISLLSSENVYKHINFLNLRKYLSQADMLDGILSLVQDYAQLDEQDRILINEMRSSIKYEGRGSLGLNVSLLCIPTHIKSNSEYLVFTTNDTCYLPLEFSTSGMPYKLQSETLLQTIKTGIPKKINNTLTLFFNNTDINLHLPGFNILGFKTRGEMMRNLLLFLASKPYIKTEFKKAMVSTIPYVRIDGTGALAPVIITNCPEIHSTTSTDADKCGSSPNSIITTKLNSSVFNALDDATPNTSLKIMIDYINKQDIMLTRLKTFEYQRYKTKGDLLQALLAFIWSHKENQKTEQEAAKILLPHVIFHGPGQDPPDFEESCYITNRTIKFNKDNGIRPSVLVYPTNKTCLNKVKNSPGIVVYRIEIPSLFQALEPDIPREQYLPVSTFLSKPYAYEYVRGIDIERYTTNGELLRAVLTFLRFTPRYLEPHVKEALMKILPSINLSGPGKFLVDRRVECSPLTVAHILKSIDLNGILHAIMQYKFSMQISDALNAVVGYITSPKFNLTEYVTWLDMEQPITKGELLKLIFLKILDKNPTIGKHVLQLLSQIQENSGIGKETFSFKIKKYKKLPLPTDTDYMQLSHVLKPEAPQQSVTVVFDLLGKQDVNKYLQGFDATKYETKGKLLIGVLMFLHTKYNASTELGKAILDLIPHVDLEHVGALPPIIKKVYITTNTSVDVFTLDLGSLYTIIPRNNLSTEGTVALNAIFKYLSTEDVDYEDLLQGISTSLPLQLQLKMILNKLKVIGDIYIRKHVDVLLAEIEEQLFLDSYQYREVIPDIDWIEVLHAIPDSGVPIEVTEGKKYLYYFFLSSAFKTVTHEFQINLYYNRAKFLKVLLAFLRSKPEVTRIKTVKNAIAYVYMFIKEEGSGLQSVQDDIILPEQQEEALSAQNRIKELLYQVFGLIEQEGAFEILQTLQKLLDSSTKLNLATTYLGYDVLEEFPPKERLIIILRRIYHNFIMFLDQDTKSAIDMVFISLGETKEQTSQSFHFLPIKIDELMTTVLGKPTPTKVAAAKETISSHVDLPSLPLGKSFQDTVPSILNLEPRPRLAVILRILWRIYLKEKDTKFLEAIKTVYEYIQPQTLENEILTQEHHTAIVAALTGLVRSNAPLSILNAKQIIIEQLKKQKDVYDKSLASLATKNLSPKELVARALRKFREHQHKLVPKLWIAISNIFEYLGIPEHDYSEDEVEEGVNIVDEFKFLTDEEGPEMASSKRLLLQFLVDKKQEVSKIFHGQSVLRQYAPKEKMAIILKRLLRMYGEKLEPQIVNAVENILSGLNDTVPNEIDEEQIDVLQLLDSVIDDAAPEIVIAAKELMKTTLQENPMMIQSTLKEIIIQEDYNEHRQLAIIIRHLYKKNKLAFNKEIIQSMKTIFRYLNVSPEMSSEDQFAGNFTFEPLFHRVFPEDEIPEEIAIAIKKILNILNNQINIKHILHGINLWKLPLDTQVSLILYRLSKHGTNLTDDVKEAVTLLLDSLDTDLEELAEEDFDESYTPEKLFNEAFGNLTIPAEVQEAKGIVIHLLLSGSPVIKDIYRGIDFTNISSPTDRLVAVLKNMHMKQQVFGIKMNQALQVLSDFLKVKLGDKQLDPYTFDFVGLFDRTILSSLKSIQNAKKILLNSIRRRQSIFKKILQNVSVEDYEHDTELVHKILNAIMYYRNQTLTARLRTAAEHLSKFLRGDPISDEESQLLMKNYTEDEDEAIVKNDEIGLRIFQADNSTIHSKKHWKRRKSKRMRQSL